MKLIERSSKSPVNFPSSDHPPSDQPQRAIVIGASIAGLLSARVLRDYFAEVIILERDQLPTTPQARRGVPQSVQSHVLLTKGYRLLCEFFPDIELQLQNHGVLMIDWAREFQHFVEGQWGKVSPTPSDIVSITCSRYLLEWIIAQELLKLPGVTIQQQSKVRRLTYDSQQDQITGVELISGEEFRANLVVDTSGRSSQAPQWLGKLGLTPPSETVVNPQLGYVTRRYRLPAEFPADWKVMLISQTPPHDTRLGYLAKIENEELIATLGGYSQDFPPIDDHGFLKFAQSLAQPNFYQAIAHAEPSSPIFAHRATTNRLRHYEQTKLPRGFIALGDAVCALCPVYGQGMTLSALGAKTLQKWLMKSHRQRLDNNRFHQELAKSNSFNWMVATSQDSRFPATTGHQERSDSLVNKLMTNYMTKLQAKSTSDSQLHLLFLEVTHQLRSPLSLYYPQVLWQVLV